jgi:hypothetical protein
MVLALLIRACRICLLDLYIKYLYWNKQGRKPDSIRTENKLSSRRMFQPWMSKIDQWKYEMCLFLVATYESSL